MIKTNIHIHYILNGDPEIIEDTTWEIKIMENLSLSIDKYE